MGTTSLKIALEHGNDFTACELVSMLQKGLEKLASLSDLANFAHHSTSLFTDQPV